MVPQRTHEVYEGGNTLRPASAPLQHPPQRQHQQLGAALAAQQHEIETLRAELATMRGQLGERRTTQARGKAASQVDNRQTVAAIYKRYNLAKLMMWHCLHQPLYQERNTPDDNSRSHSKKLCRDHMASAHGVADWSSK